MGCGSSKQEAQISVLDELAAKNVELQAKMDAMAQQQQESAAAALAVPAVEQTSVIDEALVSHLARVLQMPKYEKKNPSPYAYPGHASTHPTYPSLSRACSCSCLVKSWLVS